MGISIWQLVIVLGIVVLLFGTKKLRNLGGDIGGAVKGFKKAMSDEESKPASAIEKKDEQVIDVKAEKVEEEKKTS